MPLTTQDATTKNFEVSAISPGTAVAHAGLILRRKISDEIFPRCIRIMLCMRSACPNVFVDFTLHDPRKPEGQMQRFPVISNAREELADAVGSGSISPPSPIACSPWLAMSIMQKAIRRGREDLALRAAASLLRDSPDRLWWRCGVIAFEDIGVADLVNNRNGCRRARRQGVQSEARRRVAGRQHDRGQQWRERQKERAADDLFMIIERHPALEQARRHILDAGDARPPRHRNRVKPPAQARPRPMLRDRHRQPALRLSAPARGPAAGGFRLSLRGGVPSERGRDCPRGTLQDWRAAL